MGKNKAASVDELMDIIFQEKEWTKMEKRLREKRLIKRNWKDENFENNKEEGENLENIKMKSTWINHVKYRLAKNLTKYLNYIVQY